MTFKDIFKQSFLNGFSGGIDTMTVLFGLGLACALGLYIFLIYRALTRKTFYSLNFNISLVAMSVITAAIILTIQSNLVISLGMVGALSIVRFRTAIKDPMDLVFLYWAIGVGIICGAGLSVICVALCLVMTLIVFLLSKYPARKMSRLLVVNSTRLDSEQEIMEKVKAYTKVYQIKSKNLTPSTLDMIIELRVDEECALVRELMTLEGVTAASLMAHSGETTV
ncbi:MAG: DUF4956 domain-containing protein [Ruminococcus sp.]|nr:DUF4956 domain-containing protein [Ruminococcus sp.]